MNIDYLVDDQLQKVHSDPVASRDLRSDVSGNSPDIRAREPTRRAPDHASYLHNLEYLDAVVDVEFGRAAAAELACLHQVTLETISTHINRWAERTSQNLLISKTV